MTISRTKSWAKHTAHARDVRKPRCITIHLKEANVCVFVCVDWNYLGQNKNRWQTLIFVFKNVRLPLTMGNFLIS
jgi:hypothetical protein